MRCSASKPRIPWNTKHASVSASNTLPGGMIPVLQKAVTEREKKATDSGGLQTSGADFGDHESIGRVSKKAPSFAVARNWGIGSRSFSADVKAFERLHIERAANSSYSGLKYSLCTGAARCFGRSISPSMNA